MLPIIAALPSGSVCCAGWAGASNPLISMPLIGKGAEFRLTLGSVGRAQEGEMRRRLLPLVLALSSLLSFATAASSDAEQPPPPPADAGPATEPDDPNAAPYPPDGVTDPNAQYPTDGTEGTDQGEAVRMRPPPPRRRRRRQRRAGLIAAGCCGTERQCGAPARLTAVPAFSISRAWPCWTSLLCPIRSCASCRRPSSASTTSCAGWPTTCWRPCTPRRASVSPPCRSACRGGSSCSMSPKRTSSRSRSC